MMLIDDPEKTVIEPLTADKTLFKKVYDFTLIQNGGHLTGYLLDKQHAEKIEQMLTALYDTGVAESNTPLLFAVGDGNHSLATAKACYEKLKAEANTDNKITVVLVEPGKLARIAHIGTSLSELQAAVGGNIETFYPYEEEVCIVCDDEGKICGKPLNRAIYNEDGTIMDIMAGTFFICDCSTPSFGSLNEEQQQRFLAQFKYPEQFIKLNGEITAIKYKPERNEAR